MLAKDVFDGLGKHDDGVTGARPAGREQDQSGVRLTPRQPLSGEGTKVLDVVGDHSAVLSGSGFENLSVAASSEITAVGDRMDVVAAVAEQFRDPRRELLVEEGSHPRSARSPALTASRPRRYSTSLSSISASISSRYSP